MSSIAARLPTPIRSFLARGIGSSLFSGLAVVFLLTLSGKFIAFVKEALVASSFGVADDLDVFMLVFSLMSFALTVIAGGLPSSFMSVYADLKVQKGMRRANRLGVQAAGAHFVSLVCVGLFIVVAGHYFVGHLAHGFSLEKREHAQEILVRLIPLLLAYGMSFHFSSWLQAEKRFFLVAASPLFVPLTIIVFMLATHMVPSIDVLVFSTNLGAVLQCAVLVLAVGRQLPRSGRWWRLTLSRMEPGLRTAGRLAFPFLISGLVFSITAVVDQTMASWLPSGSVTVLNYSEKLCGIILGVIAGPAADVLFPYFADQVAKEDWRGLRMRLIKSVALIVGGAIPLVFILVAFAGPIVGLLFERGEFGPDDNRRVVEVLRYGALQIPFFITGIVTARVVVSLQASSFMLWLSLGAFGINAGLNWVLMSRMGVAGIALSTVFVQAATACAACVFCFRLFRQKEAESVASQSPGSRRLAFIIRDLGHGGAQRQLVLLAGGLARHGHQVSVIHFYDGAFRAELEEAGVQTLCVGKKSRWDLLGFFFRLVMAARRVRPDVLHGYLSESNLMALFLKPFCGSPRVVWGVRDSQTDAHLWGVLGKLSFRLNCLLARFADTIICNSKAGSDYYVARGYPKHRMHVVPNGIDVDRFKPAPSKHPLTFGLVGRLSPMKDLATFIRAAALVPNARFVIVGSGDEDYAQEMRKLAKSLRVAKRITWLPAQSDMPSVYAGFDCLVNSSAFGEGFSNVIGEAMACGVPCIASDVGDSAWIIGNRAQIFPAGNHKALARCMRRFKPTTETRARIVAEFSVERLIHRTGQLLAKRVLWITTGLGSGGAEMMLAQIVRGLPNSKHSVVSLTAGGKHAEAISEVYSLDMPAGRPTLGALWRLMKIVRQAKPDVIMGWMYHGCLVAAIARFMRFRRATVVWNIRQSLYDLKLEKRGSAWVIRALAWLSWLPKRITYNSQLSAQQHEAIGYAKVKTQLIPNGFDLEKWKPGEPIRARIGRFGRNAAMKDYATFIEASKLITRKHPEATFIIVGAETESLVVPSNVEVLGERHDLPELTASLNIAVSSSAFGEGFPNVVGEAMACAVPVVATDIGDTRWVMGETGRVVPPRDPEALASACLEILDAGILQDHAARERIETHFSLPHSLEHFDSLLNSP